MRQTPIFASVLAMALLPSQATHGVYGQANFFTFTLTCYGTPITPILEAEWQTSQRATCPH